MVAPEEGDFDPQAHVADADGRLGIGVAGLDEGAGCAEHHRQCEPDLNPLEEPHRKDEVRLDAPRGDRLTIVPLHEVDRGVDPNRAGDRQVTDDLGPLERERRAVGERGLEELQIQRWALRFGLPGGHCDGDTDAKSGDEGRAAGDGRACINDG